MRCAATTTIRERLECLADVLAIDDPVSNRHVVDALGAVASLEQLVEAARDFSRGSRASGAGLAPAEMQRRYDNLAAALAAVGPGEETAG